MEAADKKVQELSEFIRAAHGKLRNEYRKVQDPDAAWALHSNNKQELQQYAAAMHKLAEHWETKVEDKDFVCRISWCYEAVQTYFRKGDLEKTRDKELRTASFHLPHLLGPAVAEDQSCDKSQATTTTTTAAAAAAANKSPSESPTLSSTASTTITEPSSLSAPESKTIVYGDRLKVLDVGSCYNPFSRYQDLDVTALDLQPATEDVYQCDFLKLDITECGYSTQNVSLVFPTEKSIEVRASDEKTAAVTSKTITSLPTNSFDAIMFSFLLSYIPSPELRLKCCRNAYRLLKPEGVLVIAAADSRGVTSNGYLYKCWQITMASLGFVRIKYEKFKDFHGMVFRKGLHQEVWQLHANIELQKMKTKKMETESALVAGKGNIKRSNRREKQMESFDLDKAFVGLWLPHDFRDTDEEEHVVKLAKSLSSKTKREASPDPSENGHEASGPASKTCKYDCPSQEQDARAEQESPTSRDCTRVEDRRTL